MCSDYRFHGSKYVREFPNRRSLRICVEIFDNHDFPGMWHTGSIVVENDEIFHGELIVFVGELIFGFQGYITDVVILLARSKHRNGNILSENTYIFLGFGRKHSNVYEVQIRSKRRIHLTQHDR